MRSWVDIEEGRGERSAYSVMMNVISISHVLWNCLVYNTLRMTLCVSCRSFLGIDLSILRAWVVLKKHLLLWVVSCGRMTLALCLILLRTT